MAIQLLNRPILLNYMNDRSYVSNGSFTLNATGDHCQLIGRVYLPGLSGSKTISAAGGGSIITSCNAVTFATLTSEFRGGIEDVDANGFGDGTQDVFGAKIQGTDTITASALNRFTMTSGTKTISHNDKISISFRFTTRAGADSIAIGSTEQIQFDDTTQTGLPYGINGAAGGAGSKTSSLPWAIIKFDDGTLGWINQLQLVNSGVSETAINFNNSSTPDEYVAGFRVPVPIQTAGAQFAVDNIAAGDTFEIILYEDIFGTPNALATVAIDPTPDIFVAGSTTKVINVQFALQNLSPGTDYGIACRPTSANNITIYYTNLGTGFDDIKPVIPFLTDITIASRSNQSGSFSVVQAFHFPWFGLMIHGLEDGSGGGGGAFAYAFPG